MTPADFLTTILVPGLTWLTETVGPKPPASPEARLLLLAIAGQESGWQNIAQSGGGPGRGPWQFEPETCRELMFNPASDFMFDKICMALNVVPSRCYVSLMSQPNFNLAVSLARLDLWCDPHALPPYGDEDAAWTAYLRIWRPGAPSRDRWATVYPEALAADKAWAAGQKA